MSLFYKKNNPIYQAWPNKTGLLLSSENLLLRFSDEKIFRHSDFSSQLTGLYFRYD